MFNLILIGTTVSRGWKAIRGRWSQAKKPGVAHHFVDKLMRVEEITLHHSWRMRVLYFRAVIFLPALASRKFFVASLPSPPAKTTLPSTQLEREGESEWG